MCNIQQLLLVLVITVIYKVQGLDQESTKECTCKNSYMWKVEAEPPIYLYGTLHVPYTKIWNRIPDNQKTAFSSSQSLFMELELTDSKTIKKLYNCQFLPNGEDLHAILPIDLYERVQKYFERMKELFLIWLQKNNEGGVNLFLEETRDAIYNGVTLNWQKRRPIWLLFLLDSLTENLIRYRSTPIFDTFLDNAADNLEKKTAAIENVVDHCRPLNTLDQDKVIIALRKKLDYMEPLAFSANGPPSNEDVYIKTYFCGDFEELVSTTEILPLPNVLNMTGITPFETQAIQDMNEYLRKQIVYRRNRRMTKAITKMLENKTRNETSFFAVGAGHFFGRKGIVDILQKNNYTVTRVSLDEQIDGPELPKDIIALGDPSSVHKILTISKEMVTPPPSLQTLPPLSNKEISAIFNEVLNNTNSPTRQINPAKVSISPSVTIKETTSSAQTSPSPSPITRGKQESQQAQQSQTPAYITTSSGIIIAITEEPDSSNTEKPNAANSIRWNTIGIILLVTLTISIFNKLL